MQLFDLGYLEDLETSTESPHLVSGGSGPGSLSAPAPTATVGVTAQANGATTFTNAQTNGYTYYDPRTRELVSVAYGVGYSVARTPVGSGKPPSPSYPSYPWYPYRYPYGC
jgi:hypothetical protein